jgi:DNA-directed RNA polymerase specialized sigma24 family protein
MTEADFEAALVGELPLAERGLRRRFPDTAVGVEETAAAARKEFARGGGPAGREGFFNWLFGVAFRRHVLDLAAAAVEQVRAGVTPLCRGLNVDPEDVMQEAWLHAQRAVERRGEQSLDAYGRDDVRRWLWRIAANVAHDFGRQRSRRKSVALLEDPPAAGRPDFAPLHDCLDRLPAGERQAVDLLLEGRKPARIAGDLGLPTAQVYYLIRRAKLHLQLCLGEGGGEP